METAFTRFGSVPNEFCLTRCVQWCCRIGTWATASWFERGDSALAAHWRFHLRACEDLNEQASRWLEETANVRRHGTTSERPVERDEQEALRPRADRAPTGTLPPMAA